MTEKKAYYRLTEIKTYSFTAVDDENSTVQKTLFLKKKR